MLDIEFIDMIFTYSYFIIFFDETYNCRYERDQNDSALHVSHEAKYEAYWEPFYVSQDDITPPHDERFLGYGHTRNSQVFT